jgi:hypothetical protein
MRWTEETLLLLEEMRRTLQFLDWQAGFWVERAGVSDNNDITSKYCAANLVGSHILAAEWSEGVRAYALRQAGIRTYLRDHFKNLWCGVPALVMSKVGRDSSVAVDLGAGMEKELAESSSFLRSAVP